MVDFGSHKITDGKMKVLCRICKLYKWGKVMKKEKKKMADNNQVGRDTWDEIRVKVKVLPHQSGRTRCLGSGKIKQTTWKTKIR